LAVVAVCNGLVPITRIERNLQKTHTIRFGEFLRPGITAIGAAPDSAPRSRKKRLIVAGRDRQPVHVLEV